MRNVNFKRCSILSAASTEMLPYNKNRIGLILSPPQSSAYEINFNDDAVVGTGLRMAQGNPPFVMWKEDYGDSVADAVRAIADGVNLTVGIAEIVEVS